MLLEKVLVHVQPSATNGFDDNALSPYFHRVFVGDDTVLENWNVLKDTVVAFPVAEELHRVLSASVVPGHWCLFYVR
jgi:hypothetical protein